MGQKPLCCVGKERDGVACETSRLPPPAALGGRPVEAELARCQTDLEELQKAVGNLQGEMWALRSRNGELLQVNTGLSSENRKLRRSAEDQDASAMWNKFDIVEEHYKQVEMHRRFVTKGDLAVPVSSGSSSGSPRSSAWTSTSVGSSDVVGDGRGGGVVAVSMVQVVMLAPDEAAGPSSALVTPRSPPRSPARSCSTPEKGFCMAAVASVERKPPQAPVAV